MVGGIDQTNAGLVWSALTYKDEMMNKDINPIVAFAIIGIFLVPVAFWFLAADGAARARAGSFYLEQTADSALSVQTDHLLLTYDIPSGGYDTLDLRTLGVEDLMGNVVHLPNNEFMVRSGGVNWGLNTALSLGASKDKDDEIMRQKAADKTPNRQAVFRCSLNVHECERYFNITAPWRHRLMFDKTNGHLFLTEGTRHRVREFDSEGKLVGVVREGMKFPKRVRRHNELLHLVDTNNHRVLFFEHNEQSGMRLAEARLAAPSTAHPNRWTLDAVFFADSWWVLNAQSSMQNTVLHRFDSDWRYREQVQLNDSAEPFDMLVYEDTLLVSDISTGMIYRFDSNGARLPEVLVQPAYEHISALSIERRSYERDILIAQISLAFLFVAGLALAVVYSRKSH